MHDALSAEAEGRLAESFALCRPALANPAQQADAFNLFGRLCLVIGDAANAIASQRYVLAIDPGNVLAARDLAIALSAVRSADEGQNAYRRAVAIHSDLAIHHRDPVSLQPFEGMDDAESALHEAIFWDPALSAAHASLGNIRARQSRHAEALDAYRLAAMLAWEWADAHLALSQFFDSLRDDENAERHRHLAFARRAVYPAAVPAASLRILALMAPGGPTANAPLDYNVDHARVALHAYYLTSDTLETELPEYDIAFNAIDDAESSADAIARSAAFLAAQSKPAINDPSRLVRVRRSVLPQTLRDVAGCRVPPAARVDRERLPDANAVAFPFPWVVRPIDTHRGDWQERIATVAELEDYLERAPGDAFNVSAFVDYRSPDGYYRKYRVIIVDGRPHAYHLAISDAWQVHYRTSPMSEFAWMREEEQRFLERPESVFASWSDVFGAIADAVGLDYFGVDCSLAADRTVIVFECGPNMFYQSASIGAALEAMLVGRSKSASPA